MSGLKITQFNPDHDPAVGIAALAAASSTPLGGDLSGTPPAAVVEKINGITITGAPSAAGDEIIATSTTAAHWATPAALSNPMTTQDDLIVGGTVTGGVAAPTRLGKGSDGQVLTVDPATHHLYWATPAGGSLEVKEADGSPDVTGVTKIVVPNGSLTDNTGGQVTIAFPGGGGVTVQDEGTPLATVADTLNFAGAGVTATGAGTTKTITIPGGGGGLASPDDVPASPSATDQEFSGALGTWTAHGTLDSFNITDFPGLGVHILKNATGGFTLSGEFAAIPSFPFFMYWKVEDMIWANVAYAECGVALAAAGTNGPYFVWGGLATGNYGYAIYNTRTSRSAWGGDVGLAPVAGTRRPYCGIMATTTSNIATYVSENGSMWRSVQTGINPGFTITQFGPFVTGQDNSVTVNAIMRFIRFRASV